jgi:hypothetical protein
MEERTAAAVFDNRSVDRRSRCLLFWLPYRASETASAAVAWADFGSGGGAIGAPCDGGVFGSGDSGPSVDPQPHPQCGQTHSIVHFRTGTSTVYGIFTSVCTSRYRQLQWPCSRPPLLQPPFSVHPLSQQPLPHVEQQGERPGMHSSAHWQQ